MGAVTGSLRRPAAVIAGLMRDGELTVAGRTTELAAGQASELGAVMTVAAADHPWPERISAGVFGSRRCQQPPKIDPWLRLKLTPGSVISGFPLVVWWRTDRTDRRGHRGDAGGVGLGWPDRCAWLRDL